MSVPTVSFLVPTIGSSPCLPEVISALGREATILGDVEIIVLDNASPCDLQAEVGPELAARCRFIRIEPRIPATASHQRLLDEAAATCVRLVHDDDVVESGSTARMVDVIRGAPHLGGVMCLFRPVGPSQPADGHHPPWLTLDDTIAYPSQDRLLADTLANYESFHWSASMINRSACHASPEAEDGIGFDDGFYLRAVAEAPWAVGHFIGAAILIADHSVSTRHGVRRGDSMAAACVSAGVRLRFLRGHPEQARSGTAIMFLLRRSFAAWRYAGSQRGPQLRPLLSLAATVSAAQFRLWLRRP